MEIVEEENPNKIIIRKFQFTCDGKDDTIPAPLPQTYNHFMVITAKPKQGKTTLIYNLLTKQNKLYNKKFDKIYIFSPSLKTIDDDPFKDVDDEQKFSELNKENLQHVYDEVEDSGERVLLVMDDIVNDIKKNEGVEKLLCKMMMNRRHICGRAEDGDSCGISCWITTQVFNKLSRPLRASASHHIIFKTSNKKELDTIFDELILLEKQHFNDMLKFVYDKPFNFLFINSDESFDKMYNKNFNRLKITMKDNM